MPVPLRVSATSLEHRLFNGLEPIESSLNLSQGDYFRDQLMNFEYEKSTNLSLIYSNSSLNLFLDRVLLWTHLDLPLLEIFHPEFMRIALERTAQSLANVAIEWDILQESFFLKQGRSVPERPIYGEIQKGLEILESKYHSFLPR
jgi:hypothetical protein